MTLDKYKIIAICISLIYILVMSWYTVYRFERLGSGYYDLGYYTQILYNSANGDFYEKISQDPQINVNFLGIHFQPLIILLLPFYLLIDNARVLVIAQSILIGISIYFAYLLSIKITNAKYTSLLLTFIYSISFLIINVNIFDFHGVIFAIPLLMIAFYFIEHKKYRSLTVILILLLLTKENLSVTVASIGLFIAFYKKNLKYGLITFTGSLLYCYLIMKFVIPYFSVVDEVTALPLYRINVVNRIISMRTIEYFITTLRHYSFLPLFSPPHLLIALPELLINIVGKEFMKRFNFHYTAVLAPIYYYAFISGYMFVRSKIKNTYISYLFYLVLLIMAFSTLLKYTLLNEYLLNKYHFTHPTSQSGKDTLQMVDKWVNNLEDGDISVCSSNRLGAHFGNRKHYYYFLYDVSYVVDPNLKHMSKYLESGKTRYQKANYVIIDSRDISPYDPIAVETMNNLINDPSFTLIEKKGYIYVYKKIE